LKLLAEGSGEGFTVAFGVGFTVGLVRVFPSTIVTFIFCPGIKF
jgi:hypothetical protein